MQGSDNVVDRARPGGGIAIANGALEGAIVAVLNGIVSAAGQRLSNGAPLVAELLVHGQDDVVLARGPILLTELRIELIDPTLARLLARPVRQVRGDQRPVARAEVVHQMVQMAVFVQTPWAARWRRTLGGGARLRQCGGRGGRGRGRGGMVQQVLNRHGRTAHGGWGSGMHDCRTGMWVNSGEGDGGEMVG